MQDVNSDIVANTAEGATKTLKDKRDNIDYTVAKINGSIWMTSNLLFQGTSLEPLTSNVAATRTLNGVTYNGCSLNDNASTSSANCYGDASGNGGEYANSCMYYTSSDVNSGNKPNAWYNYSAATAGTITGSSTTATATESICPKGWGLPSYSQYNSLISAIGSSPGAFIPVHGGYYNNGSSNYTQTVATDM